MYDLDKAFASLRDFNLSFRLANKCDKRENLHRFKTTATLMSRLYIMPILLLVSLSAHVHAQNHSFRPWDHNLYPNHYTFLDGQWRLTKGFEISEDTSFSRIPSDDDGFDRTRRGTWFPLFAPSFTGPLFNITGKGITIDGRNVRIVGEGAENIDGDTLYRKPHSVLNDLDRPYWSATATQTAFDIKEVNIDAGSPETVIKRVAVYCFSRGLSILTAQNPGGHPVRIEDSEFRRNVTNIYMNTSNALIRNNLIREGPNTGVYVGSTSYNNALVGNTFENNFLFQTQKTYNESYGQLVVDAAWSLEISDNVFKKNTVDGVVQVTGISIYRNKGEGKALREDIPHDITVSGNTFYAHDLGIHVGSRMGRPSHDLSLERRGWAFGNRILQNTFYDTNIGIKVNTDGNIIEANTFNNSHYPIVLHCVHFSLKNITIRNQPNETIKLFLGNESFERDPDYGAEYARWFRDHSYSNGAIERSEKLIEVITARGGVGGWSPRSAITRGELIINQARNDENRLWHPYAGNPIKTVSGEFFQRSFSDELETASIYDKPISRIQNPGKPVEESYNIVIHNSNGIEIDRQGRSPVKWRDIAVGYFTANTEDMQIAAVPADPINGRYPVYIFNRGFAESVRIAKINGRREVVGDMIWVKDNTSPNIEIKTRSNSIDPHSLLIRGATGHGDIIVKPGDGLNTPPADTLIYRIRNRQWPRQHLDADGRRNRIDTAHAQLFRNDKKWRLIPAEHEYFYIENARFGLKLRAKNAGDSDCDGNGSVGDPASQWRLIQRGDYRWIQNRRYKTFLDLDSGSAGATLKTKATVSGLDQEWRVTEI